MTSLPTRLEGAAAGSRELDHLVENAVGQALFERPDKYDPASDDYVRVHRPVTTSIDAAVALAERVLGGDVAVRTLWEACLRANAPADVPRMVCAAIIRAHAEQVQG